MVTLLLEHGADIYVKDRWGNTPITDANLSASDKIYFQLLAEHVKFKKDGSVKVDSSTGEVHPPSMNKANLLSDVRMTSVNALRRESARFYEHLSSNNFEAASSTGAIADSIFSGSGKDSLERSSMPSLPYASDTSWDPPAARTLSRMSVSMSASSSLNQNSQRSGLNVVEENEHSRSTEPSRSGVCSSIYADEDSIIWTTIIQSVLDRKIASYHAPPITYAHDYDPRYFILFRATMLSGLRQFI